MAERRPIGWWALALAVVLGAGGLALTLAAGSPELPGNADDPLPVALASTGFLLPFAIVCCCFRAGGC